MKEGNMNKLERDPSLTMDVKNEEVEAALLEYGKNNTHENLGALLSKFRNARVLVPAEVNEKNQPYPCALKNNEEELFVPIYTSKEQIPSEPKSAAILNLSFLAVVKMAANQEMKVSGIAVNPFSHNMILKRTLIQRIMEVEEKGAQTKKLELTPEQYVVFEKIQFQRGFLPKIFFENPEKTMEKILEEKENYIDALFEEAFREQRMYPYLPEDFSVMVMNVSEELTVVRVDYPNRDMGEGVSVRTYLAWNKATETARYFMIESVKPEEFVICEVDKELNRIDHGPAPVEGAELQFVIDRL